MNDSALPMNDALTDGLMGDFLDESTGLMRRLNDGLSRLDADVKNAGDAARHDEELLNDIFRAAHSLKGLSAMLNLDDINALTHRVENVFDAVRTGRIPVTSDVVDVSFQAIDRLDAMLEILRGHESGEVEYAPVLEVIEDVLRSGGRRSGDAVGNAKLNDSVQASLDPLAGVEDDADVPAKYLAIFIDETDLTLDSISDVLLQKIDSPAVESLLVWCHRIKGSAASIGLRRAARLAHLTEDCLQEVRRRETLPTATELEALQKAVDALRSYVTGLRLGSTGEDGLSEACRKVAAAASRAADVAGGSLDADGKVQPDLTLREIEEAVAAAPPDVAGFIGYCRFELGLTFVEFKIQLLLERLGHYGTLFFHAPHEEEVRGSKELTHLVFGLTTELDRVELRKVLTVSGVVQIELNSLDDKLCAAVAPHSPRAFAASSSEPVESVGPANGDHPETGTASLGASSPAPSSATATAAAGDAKSKPTETLRVDIERLDQLMNLAGQLVITKARFNQIGQEMKRLFSNKSLTHTVAEAMKQLERLTSDLREAGAESDTGREALTIQARRIQDDLGIVQRDLLRFNEVRGVLGDLAEAVHQLDRVSDGIQASVMDTRMVPIGPLFSRFKRVVRDLSRGSGKEIDLVIRGEHTELDKRMIDELGDPLIHLIRNSADHGIEMPDVREQAGKPRNGTITLNAFHRGNRIVIQVSDDGRGLDADRIRAKAVAKGWMNEAEAASLSNSQVYQLIWRPGFSTAERITEVSGRGMGMDIVWSKIEQLNGSVELTSTPGQGATFEIKLPLTMAILPSLMMVIDRDVYAVPVESVVEIVRVKAAEVVSVYGKPTIRVRDRVISLVGLGDLFGKALPAVLGNDDLTLVILGSEGRELGLIVDDLIGEQDVVIKSLTENFQNVEGIAGAAILGDGRVSLILDVVALLQLACAAPRVVAAATVVPTAAPPISESASLLTLGV